MNTIGPQAITHETITEIHVMPGSSSWESCDGVYVF